MRGRHTRVAVLTLWVAFAALGCQRDPTLGSREGSPLDDLPPWIELLLPSGLRPDWSADGSRLLFLDALVGDVHELDLASGETRSLTSHFDHRGFTRARYLSSGDVLLCGPSADTTGPDGEDAGDAGRWSTDLFFLPRSGGALPRGGGALPRDGGAAQPLDEPCFEGPAVSRRDMRIAWTRSDYPEKIVLARSEIWTGRIVVEAGRARLVDKRKRLDRSDFGYLAMLETQDFRPPDERELLFTAYAWKGGEVMGLDLDTGERTNYSNDWAYDEAEGVFPDGQSIATEREVNTYTANPVGDLDIWRLALDDSGRTRRLTRFSEYAGFGANNPVVSPDGRKMAFGLRIKGEGHGNARGILLYDFERAPDQEPHPR